MGSEGAARGGSDDPRVPDGALERLLLQLDCIGGRPFQVSELSGGLTNKNYRVKTPEADLVVRVAASNAGALSIDRDNEYHNSLAAAAAGVGAPVVEYRPEFGVLVVGYIAARTFHEEDLRSGLHLARVAAACRRLHGGPRFCNDFDMFELQWRYLSIVRERGYRLPDGYLERSTQVDRIRAALSAKAMPTVPCNNDLLAGNILDDGEQIWLIDYEYSGNNDPCFELGNIWSESGLSLEQLDELVGHYFGSDRVDLVARARLHGLMSKYGWTLWASIQDGEADLDFDFWSWGMEKHSRAVAEFEGDEFDELIDTVTHGS
ncbi:MAG: phosphotransferase [Acidimicrobiales bacterium]